LLLAATALLLMLRLLAAGWLAAVATLRVLGRCILLGRRIGRCALALPGLGTAFGDGVAAVFTVFVFGHGQTSLGAVGGEAGGKDWV
jgi:hypothetical protein